MITSYSQTQRGEITTVTVVSSLTGDVWYHWYLDGSYVASTRSASRVFMIRPGTQGRVDATDSNDSSMVPPSKFADEHSRCRTVWWIRSLSTDVLSYRVEQQVDGGDWSEVGVVTRDGESWTYEITTQPLTDLADIAWRVVPIDATGNDGTALTMPAERIVRWPDAPEFTATFDAGTTKVTFAEA